MDNAPAPAPAPRPQAFRRPHHKSRLGCVQCKQRKIKCDENKPSCDKCTRYNTPCSFVGLQPSKPALEVQSGASTPNLAQRPKPNDSSHTATYSSPAVSQAPSSFSLLSNSPDSFTLLDLEILHHYTISTCFTISDLKCWQTDVVSIAVSFPFLMHGILATAGRHLAYLRPDQRDRYIIASDKHHQVALTGYRDALTELTQINCHACAAYSLILNVYAWTPFHGSGTLFLPDSDETSPNKVELITILRGGNAVMYVARPWVVEGPLRPLYKPWNGGLKNPNISRLPSVQSLLSGPDDSPILPHEDDARLERLSSLWTSPAASPSTVTNSSSSTPPITAAAHSVLFETLSLLRRVFVVCVADNDIEPQAAMLSWSVIIPDAYIEMVQQGNPLALVLLAHYCILLKRSGDRWWIEGKAEELLAKIKKTLEATGDGWLQWIEWPMQEVGEVRVRGSVSSQATTVAGTPV